MFPRSRTPVPRIPWLLSAGAMVLAAADPSWMGKPTPEWTEEDARQVLTDSPWAKTVRATIARPPTEDERREGGNMGQPHGIGYDGIEDTRQRRQMPTSVLDIVKPDASPAGAVHTLPVTLRWESALPIKVAELKSHLMEPPTLDGDGYSLAVYGIPESSLKGDPKTLGEPFKRQALLRREGKKDARPSSVEVFESKDGLVIVYLFPPSIEISPSDRRIEFDAVIGRISLAQAFDLEQMRFQGRLAL